MIFIDVRDRRPIYEQLVERFSDLMIRGVLTTDSPMPSVRTLAAELSITPNTVQRAYAELERQGYIYSIKGKGSYVADVAPLFEKGRIKICSELSDLAGRAFRAGMSEKEFVSCAGRFFKESQQAGEGEAHHD